MSSLESTVDLLHLFGDPTRVRLMALLADHELSVVELTSVTELPQSRVSTHLGRLKDAGLLRDRKVGASAFYALNDGAMPAEARKLWDLVSRETSDAVLVSDRARCAELLRARREATSWPDSIAGQMERHYSPGRTWEATARGLIELVQLGDVLDVGSGDGVIAGLMAPRSKSVTCLDRSERMIAAAKKRLAGLDNVHFTIGDMHELPFRADSFDQVLLFNTLTYAHQAERVLAETARVLRPGGSAVLITLSTHTHTAVTAAYSHLNAGFSSKELARLLGEAGLEVAHSSVTSRERRKPHFEVVTALAHKPAHR
jgi:SAM-dependent methyltransferase